MKHLLNKKVGSIQISGIRQFSDKISSIENIVSLTIGQPDFLTPDYIKEAGKLAIDHNHTPYAPNAGISELRKIASEVFNQKYNLNYLPSETIITNGSTEGIYLSLRAILSEGDEVILPTPAYSGYEPVIHMCGGVTKFVNTIETGFKLTAEIVERSITNKTKAIIIPFPSNPTGATMNKEELAKVVKVLEDNDIFIISDELYSELVFDTKHISIATFPSVREKTIVINGVSKSHAMTGWRIGFVFAPEYIIQEMLKIHQYVNTSVNTMAQFAAVGALSGTDEAVKNMVDQYKTRRDFLFEKLSNLGFSIVIPEGTFYLFPEIPKQFDDSYQFCLDLAEKARVGMLPSSVFTDGGNHHVRISFAYSMEKLKEAVERLNNYLS
ncbi:MAG: aminotransferase class I/II-fold pyridoxal phosphate-dependent enzyme [Bacillota bacterium]|nr:aminotransferase class I/II-fold pyridoxal phosphate-dependent enzyme [Bacillota bacterium]